jgi:WD40 repeat protein/serine/threonine protein kinase
MSTLNVVESIFITALEKETPEARAAYLAEACAGDANLRRCVERLLSAHARADSILPGLPVPGEPPPIEERPGSVVGPYKLRQQLGEGGFGVVFMAEQEQPVRRLVALKIIKPGMDSRQVVARFEAERQALALMDHPNIARVLDGGTTPGGRPYFVMELVKGTPITEFCDQNQLTPRERLELFIPVCQAVQHAHQKGIIHRDLKPSNVLVTMYDDKPVPKVIDFGVAKAIEQKLTEQTLFTLAGQVIGTLDYMSPEQASPGALDVDTRADVYALGVLLYELLTGTTPLGKDRLQGVAFLEMLRLIREEEPPRPSTRLSESGDALTAYAVYRRTDTQKLPALVRGELDLIAMKALDKDRSRRYDTANALAADVQRYLADEPVEACPPTLGYRVQKYVRRHKALIGAVSAVAAMLLVGIAATSWQAVRATRAEGKALTALDDAVIAGEREAQQRALAVAAADEAKANERKAKASEEKAQEQTLRAETALHAGELHLAQLAWERNDLVEAERLLDGAGDRFRQTWEHRYLRDLCLRKARWLTGHTGAITGVAMSADGTRVASASTDRTVKLWDATTGKVLFTLSGHEAAVNGVAMSADGKCVVSGSDDGTVMVWDAVTGKRSRTLKGHAVVVQKVNLPKDGALALRYYDLVFGKSAIQKAIPKGVLCVAISADGRRIVSGGADKTVRVWDGMSEKPTLTFAKHDRNVVGIAISSDGRRVVSIQGYQGLGGGLAGGSSAFVKTWDAATGQEFAFKWNGLFYPPTCCAISPNGQWVVTESARTLPPGSVCQVLDPLTGRRILPLAMGPMDEVNRVTNVAFGADGRRIVSVNDDATVRVWDAENGRELLTLRGHAGVEMAGGRVAVSGDSRRIVSACAAGMRVWDLSAAPEKFATPFRQITSLAIGARGTIAACGRKWIKAWDAATGRELLAHPQPLVHGDGIAFCADGTRFVSIGDTIGSKTGNLTVTVWDAATGNPINVSPPLPYGRAWVKVAFTADGKRIVLAQRGSGVLKVLDADTFQVLSTIDGYEKPSGRAGPFAHVAISNDGQWFARSSHEGTLTVVNALTGQQELAIKDAGVIKCVEFSPDRRYLLTATEGNTVRLWDTVTGKEKLTLKGHGRKVVAVAMSADGQRVASSAEDGTVRLWDTTTGQAKLVLKGTARCLAFSPDGRLLLAGCDDRMLHVWEAPPSQAGPPSPR